MEKMAIFGHFSSFWRLEKGFWDPFFLIREVIPDRLERALEGCFLGFQARKVPHKTAHLTYRKRCEMWDSKLPVAHTSPLD
jgi:hypothetical protein